MVIFSASSKHFQGNRMRRQRKNDKLKKKGTIQSTHPGKVPPCTVYYSEGCWVNYFDDKQYGIRLTRSYFQTKQIHSGNASSVLEQKQHGRFNSYHVFLWSYWYGSFTAKSDFGSMVIQLSTHSESQKFCYFCNTTTWNKKSTK